MTTTQQPGQAEMLAYLAEHEPGPQKAWAVTYPTGRRCISWDYGMFTSQRGAAMFAQRAGVALLFAREDGTWREAGTGEPDDIACGELDEAPEVCELCGDKIRSGRCRRCGWEVTT